MKLCKNHKLCGQPAEAERYQFCKACWWKQDPRNTEPFKLYQVICEDPIDGFLTKGRAYTVIGERPEEERLVMMDDRGLEGWFKVERFRGLTCPVIETAAKLGLMEVKADPTLGPDEWHLIFPDYRDTSFGVAQKKPWGGGSNMVSTFVVTRADKVKTLERNLKDAAGVISELVDRLKHDISELEEAIEEKRFKTEADEIYYRKIVEEIKDTLGLL